jgi:hypothetical protein
MLVLSCFEMMVPQLKLLPKISMVYANGVHAFENLEKFVSPYKIN